MRSIIAVLMALVFTSGVVLAQTNGSSNGSCGSGSTSMSQQGGSTGGTGEEKQITGEVKNVNKDQKEITITGPKGNQVQYTLNDNTMIVSDTGQTMMVGDLKSGSKVTISYTGSGAEATVTKVQVKEGK